jgi:hypothetical protein
MLPIILIEVTKKKNFFVWFFDFVWCLIFRVFNGRYNTQLFSLAPRCRAAIIALMSCQKFGNCLLASVPRDVVLIIARHLHASRSELCWNATKLSSFFFRK